MIANETTPRLGLPLLAANQSQKEITHNEALVLIDALIQLSVEGVAAAPPTAPTLGQCWTVAAGATDAFAGQTGRIAIFTGGGWRFVDPREHGMARSSTDGAVLRFRAGEWTAPPVHAAPAGGAVIDTEARNAIALLGQAMIGAGILANEA